MIWQRLPQQLKLLPTERHIWLIDLADRKQAKYFYSLLVQEEIGKANRFHCETHREKYVIARGVLRLLLGRYLRIHASAIQFKYNLLGKPFIATGQNSINLQFNVSHSHHYACYAFGLKSSIGIDIEYIQPNQTYLAIAKRFFSADEYAQLIKSPAKCQLRNFYTLWTSKEALVKAQGKGVFSGLNNFTVNLQPADHNTQTVEIISDNKRVEWSLSKIDISVDYVCTVAHQTPAGIIKLFHLPNHELIY